MPILASLGAGAIGAYRMFRSAAPLIPVYIEEVFSTYLYTGNGSTQTITNGIDLAGKGGLVWLQERDDGVNSYSALYDIIRGVDNRLTTQVTNANQYNANALTSFNNNGFSLGSFSSVNASGINLVSWTFREQAKFFDVVTYTGNGANNRQISHNLGSAPGCIILKRTDGTGDWWTYHRSLGDVGGFSYDLQLNTTSNRTAYQIFGTASTQTSTYFTLGTVFANEMNGNGATYVAYLFAHDAGGFGATGSDNVISCGSFTTNGSGVATVDLGYEPQFILFKRTDGADNWEIADTMRGFSVNSNGTSSSFKRLNPNTSDAETTSSNFEMYLTSTGFKTYQYFYNATYIYIAIRRGPMKTPTSGTSVFSPVTRTGTGAIANVNCGFAPDMVGMAEYPAAIQTGQKGFIDKLRGGTQLVYSSLNIAELAGGDITQFQNNGVTLRASGGDYNVLNALYINWFFKRAPGFFDIVCYTGTSVARTINHNLTVVPELMIVKSRSATNNWTVYSAATGNTNALILNSTAAVSGPDPGDWNSTTPTASVFSLGGNGRVNASAANYVAYLFATVVGVSKVGSYTGTGTTLQVNCGFTAGARFVMIKRTDSTGDWYVWDSARGIVAGDDPYLAINTTNAQVTNTDYVDTYSAGFEISSTAPAAINANGGTYIFLAIA